MRHWIRRLAPVLFIAIAPLPFATAHAAPPVPALSAARPPAEGDACDFEQDGVPVMDAKAPWSSDVGTVELLDAGRGRKRLLRYSGKTGAERTFSYRMHMTTDTGGRSVTSPDLTAEVRVRTGGASSDGARISVAIAQLELDPTGVQGTGAEAAQRREMGKGLRESLLEWTTTPFEVPVAPTGAFDPAALQGTKLPPMVQGGIIVLPAQPVGVGARWRVVSHIKGSPSTTTTVLFTYAGEQQEMPIIQVALTSRPDPPNRLRMSTKNGVVEVVRMEIDATVRYVLDASFPFGAHEVSITTRMGYANCNGKRIHRSDFTQTLSWSVEPRRRPAIRSR